MDISEKLPAIKGTTYVVEVTTTGTTQLGTAQDTDELYYSVDVYKPMPGQPINTAFQTVASKFAAKDTTLEDINSIVADIIAADAHNLSGKYRDEEVYARLEREEREKEEAENPPEDPIEE